MPLFLATLYATGAAMLTRAHARLTDEPERGSVTIEQVVFAVLAVTVSALVVAAILAFVQNNVGQIG